MNKNLIWLIISIVAIIVIITGSTLIMNKKTEKEVEDTPNETIDNTQDKEENEENKIDDSNKEVDNIRKKNLVVYFSATNNTKNVALKIAENLKADVFVIEPKDKYTSADLDWNDTNSRVSKEHNDSSLRNIELVETKVSDWDSYENVLIGYPIWWGIAAWPVSSFVKANDFSNKTVIPFCTSASSSIGDSGRLLAETASTGNWLEGKRFSSSASDDEILKWTNSLKLGN